MERPTMLYQAMLTQVSIDLEVSTERDFEYLRSRYEHEGLSFLTLSLPILSDSLEYGIESGRFSLPNGFKPFRRGGTLPAFLQGLFKRVFNVDGSLRQDACPESIYWIRQISRFFKKPKIACSPQRNAAAIKKYLAVEDDLNAQTNSVLRPDENLDRLAKILWSTVFPTVDDSSIVCGHGPGVTADRRRSNERRRIREWYDRFETSFPVADHAFHNYGQAWSGGSDDGVNGIQFIGVRDEPPVRVVFVPKTLSSPRVIAIEPSCMQFVQQGLCRLIVSTLEGHSLTKHSIRFSDQSVNRRRAYEASRDRSLATVDLSDASDRVHYRLVDRIFSSSPLLGYLQDARSLHADLPDGTNVILNKFASMGSALCFPVEACVFYTLILTAMHVHDGRRPTYRSIRDYSRSISVYGDDLIFPTRYVDVVSDYLESYALRVNRRKSFSKSLFRESCGADYFNGHSVLPVYARQLAPARSSEWTPQHVQAWVATANQFYLLGKWHICQHIREMLQSVLRCHIPRSRVATQGIAFTSVLFDTNLRFNSSTYSYEQKRLVYKIQKRKDSIDGDGTACFNRVFERNVRNAVDIHGHVSQFDWDGVLCRWGDKQLEISSRSSPLHYELHRSEHGRTDTGPSSSVLQLDEVVSSCRQHRTTEGTLRHEGPVLQIDPVRIDFTNSTKRGVFTLKRQWVTILS